MFYLMNLVKWLGVHVPKLPLAVARVSGIS